jgi:limonene-1,2-epoxide hydrolase
VVVTERVDHLLNPAGEVLASIPLAGTLVVRDAKIAVWRDYFDPRPFVS